MGLREEKKKKTRKAISDTATLLFVKHGYNGVTMAEIAARAEVSVPTLFNYFPTKESLVFDEDFETEQKLVETVTSRKKGATILEALLEEGLASIDSLRAHERDNFQMFMKLIQETPELSAYAQQMWLRHEQSLAAAIRKHSKTKLSSLEASAIARFILDSYHRAFGASKPKDALRSLFEVLRGGWRG